MVRIILRLSYCGCGRGHGLGQGYWTCIFFLFCSVLFIIATRNNQDPIIHLAGKGKGNENEKEKGKVIGSCLVTHGLQITY